MAGNERMKMKLVEEPGRMPRLSMEPAPAPVPVQPPPSTPPRQPQKQRQKQRRRYAKGGRVKACKHY